MHVFLTITCWLYTFTLTIAAPAHSYETVQTQNGAITGHRAWSADDVWEYLGIPYAQPPLGNLRFAAPQKYSVKGPYKAANYGYDCPQQAATQPMFPGFTPQYLRILSYFTNAAGTNRGEDCLTLNIWAKPSQKSANADKPVYILFHGGRFAGGGSNSPFANGQHLANSEDIIVVSVNYRLNVFGFPGAPGADTNIGLQDQRLAVEWLQENIAAFGGNSRHMVIAGQSSGGVAVDWWSYAYERNPIVHGLMSTSGNAFSFPMNSPQKQEYNWYNLTTAVGCGSSGDTLACMRGLPWEMISLAAAKIPVSPGGSPVRSTPPFYPMVDEKLVFSDYLTLASAGRFARIPYFLGHNDYEQGYYVIPAFAAGRNVSEAQASQFLLESFVCPVSYEANRRVNFGVPTFVYRYFGDWVNTRLYPTSGAYHGTELHMILGGSEETSGIPETPAQKDTVKLFQRAVAEFTADPLNGLVNNLRWPRFNPTAETWAEIAVDNKPGLTFSKAEKYDRNCSSIVMGALSTVS
ncbi:carboxylesteras-like protein [Periconia macrospinosa]|uniref:Carboxylic ester hydrolase n=1 Tax=Periconia macrospinosa TaxID=97972 RepID=A0A2V1DQA7_9PLEO|nr:carboxylesteras-like protein [Periconia macrospinosa]